MEISEDARKIALELHSDLIELMIFDCDINEATVAKQKVLSTAKALDKFARSNGNNNKRPVGRPRKT